MKIDRVSVKYAELKSLPDFSNVRYEIGLEAMVEPGELPRSVYSCLMGIAKRRVKQMIREHSEPSPDDIPF